MARSAILTLNAGSSSLKFAVFTVGFEQRRLLEGLAERIGEPGARLVIRDGGSGRSADLARDLSSHRTAFAAVLEAIGAAVGPVQIASVGHRLAHGGPDCDCPKPVTAELVRQIEALVPLAPLHLPANLAGIAAVAAERPDLPQLACFDTAFFRDLPRLARMTGLPPDIEGPELRRYGYHGLSYEYIRDQLEKEGANLGRERIIIAHLGNGASLTALRGGRPVETTMGFSTLSGPPMGTRSGDIDPGLIIYLQRQKGLPAEAVESLLFTGSGLLGLSGISNDMRTLLSRPEPRAAEAVNFFCYQVRRQIGALAAVLGGLDRLTFTGGIGANAAEVRRRICEPLGGLGCGLDPGANARGDVRLSPPGAAVLVEARATDEEAMIARHVRGLLARDHPSLLEAS